MTTAQARLHQAALRLFAERGVTAVSITDLAEAAGVARGTVYNNLGSTRTLFEDVATRLTSEMKARVDTALAGTGDPAERLADGIRLFVRRGHEDPVWGRFLIEFGATTPTLRGLLEGGPSGDLMDGLARDRFVLRADQVPSAVAMMSSSTLAAITLVLEGHRTWRDAGADTAELVLRALGISPDEAQTISQRELPLLPPGKA